MNDFKLNVWFICDAYESGIGHGIKDDKLPNPYSEHSYEHQAYKLGYRKGLEIKESEEKAKA